MENETDEAIEQIKAEIRDSIERVKKMVAESEGFVRDHSQVPPDRPKPDPPAQ